VRVAPVCIEKNCIGELNLAQMKQVPIKLTKIVLKSFLIPILTLTERNGGLIFGVKA
jgi:hypothetical protein